MAKELKSHAILFGNRGDGTIDDLTEFGWHLVCLILT
jgi:hypothetical protein